VARNASGVYSLPSLYNPVVTRTTILTDWANTTLNDIRDEITLSLDRSGRGAMTAPLQLPDGTAALPALTFSGDTNTGAYRVGANSLGFSTDGVNRVTVNISDVTVAASQLLISVGGAGAPALAFANDADCGLYRAGADDIRFAVGGADRATFTTKLSIAAATAATGGARQDALTLTNGDLDMSSVAEPSSTTAVSNRLTPMNMAKSWVTFTINGDNPWTATVNAGFNVTSVTRTSDAVIRVTFASAFANTSYLPIGFYVGAGGGIDVGLTVSTAGRTTGYCEFSAFVASTGATIDLDSSTGSFGFLFFGEQ
jgi:hypothetical protein